jgi:prepilin-type N-terminal cleavage/methylation domain-containing protein
MRAVRRSRRGFTFVELLISMIIVGCLSAIAVPKYIDLKRRANTTKVIGDFQAVRVAVMSFYADSSYFPAETGPGEIPANLTRYLPIGFSFTKLEWTLDYENWELGDEQEFTNASALIGVKIICQDPVLGETTSRLLGNVPQVASSPSITFMVSGM